MNAQTINNAFKFIGGEHEGLRPLMTQRPMGARWFGGLGFRPNGRAGGYVASLALLSGWGPSTVVRWGWLSWTCTPGDSRPGGPPWVRGGVLLGRTPLPL